MNEGFNFPYELPPSRKPLFPAYSPENEQFVNRPFSSRPHVEELHRRNRESFNHQRIDFIEDRNLLSSDYYHSRALYQPPDVEYAHGQNHQKSTFDYHHQQNNKNEFQPNTKQNSFQSREWLDSVRSYDQRDRPQNRFVSKTDFANSGPNQNFNSPDNVSKHSENYFHNSKKPYSGYNAEIDASTQSHVSNNFEDQSSEMFSLKRKLTPESYPNDCEENSHMWNCKDGIKNSDLLSSENSVRNDQFNLMNIPSDSSIKKPKSSEDNFQTDMPESSKSTLSAKEDLCAVDNIFKNEILNNDLHFDSTSAPETEPLPAHSKEANHKNLPEIPISQLNAVLSSLPMITNLLQSKCKQDASVNKQNSPSKFPDAEFNNICPPNNSFMEYAKGELTSIATVSHSPLVESTVSSKTCDISFEVSNNSLASNESLWENESSRSSCIPFLDENLADVSGEKNVKKEQYDTDFKDTTNEENLPETSTLEDALNKLEITDPVVGLDYVIEYKDQVTIKGSFPFRCNICKSSVTRSLIIDHILGFKHRLGYLKIKDKETYDILVKDNTKLKESNICAAAAKSEKLFGRGNVIVKFKLPTPHQSFLPDNKLKPPLVSPFSINFESDNICENSVNLESIDTEDSKTSIPAELNKQENEIPFFDMNKTYSTSSETVEDLKSSFNNAETNNTVIELKKEIGCNTDFIDPHQSESNDAFFDQRKFDSLIFESLSSCSISNEEEADIVFKTIDILTKMLLRYKLCKFDKSEAEHFMNSLLSETGNMDKLLLALEATTSVVNEIKPAVLTLNPEKLYCGVPSSSNSAPCTTVDYSKSQTETTNEEQITPVGMMSNTASLTIESGNNIALNVPRKQPLLPPPSFSWSSSSNSTTTISQTTVSSNIDNGSNSTMFQTSMMFPAMPYYQSVNPSQFMQYAVPGAMYQPHMIMPSQNAVGGMTVMPNTSMPPPLPSCTPMSQVGSMTLHSALQAAPPPPPPPPLPPASKLPPLPPSEFH